METHDWFLQPWAFSRASAGAGAKTPGKAKSAEQPEKPKEKVESSMEDQDTLLKPGEAHRNTFVSY